MAQEVPATLSGAVQIPSPRLRPVVEVAVADTKAAEVVDVAVAGVVALEAATISQAVCPAR
jgi:hypothetical protein